MKLSILIKELVAVQDVCGDVEIEGFVDSQEGSEVRLPQVEGGFRLAAVTAAGVINYNKSVIILNERKR